MICLRKKYSKYLLARVFLAVSIIFLSAPAFAQAELSSDTEAVMNFFEYKEYCDMFLDPDNNNGWTTCADPATPRPFPNGDITIESFLFQDTVDLTKEENFAAVQALMRNLIEPDVEPKIPPKVVNTNAGRRFILMKNHIRSARSIAADMVASIVSRRTMIELPDSGIAEVDATAMPIETTDPDAAVGSIGSSSDNPWVFTESNTPVPASTVPSDAVATGNGRGNYFQMLDYYGKLQSGGRYNECSADHYCGKYKIGESQLAAHGCIATDTNLGNNDDGGGYHIDPSEWTGTCAGISDINSMEDFLANKNNVQERIQRDTFNGLWDALTTLTKGTNCTGVSIAGSGSCPATLRDTTTAKGHALPGLAAYMCHNIGGVLITPSGVLAAANQSLGYTEAFLMSHGQCLHYQGGKRPVNEIINMMGGFALPYQIRDAGGNQIPWDCAGYTPPQPLPGFVDEQHLRTNRHKSEICNIMPIKIGPPKIVDVNDSNKKKSYDYDNGVRIDPPGYGSAVDMLPLGSTLKGTIPDVDPPYGGALSVDAPRPVQQTVREIRERAGVPEEYFHSFQPTYMPSYNEIMLAMTKERFMDPEYYARTTNTMGALLQEQTAVEAFINVQLQDIYHMQERINALLAARASLIMNIKDDSSSMHGEMGN